MKLRSSAIRGRGVKLRRDSPDSIGLHPGYSTAIEIAVSSSWVAQPQVTILIVMRQFFSKLELLVPPPVLLLLFGAAAWTAPSVSPCAHAIRLIQLAAMVIGFAGLALNLVPKLGFRRCGTTVNPMRPEAASALVATGLYRFSRNPMYLGHAMLLLAWVLVLHKFVGLPLVILHLMYLNRFQVVPEERALLARFPNQYPDFMRATRRWL